MSQTAKCRFSSHLRPLAKILPSFAALAIDIQSNFAITDSCLNEHREWIWSNKLCKKESLLRAFKLPLLPLVLFLLPKSASKLPIADVAH